MRSEAEVAAAKLQERLAVEDEITARTGVRLDSLSISVADARILLQALAELAEHERIEALAIQDSRDIDQTLGKALGYPWYKDDPKNFPTATEADGVCTGDHVPASLAVEAADRIDRLEHENTALREALADALDEWEIARFPSGRRPIAPAFREIFDRLQRYRALLASTAHGGNDGMD